MKPVQAIPRRFLVTSGDFSMEIEADDPDAAIRAALQHAGDHQLGQVTRVQIVGQPRSSRYAWTANMRVESPQTIQVEEKA